MNCFLKVLSLCVIIFESGSANVFAGIAEVIVKVLVSNKIPDLNRTTGVVVG
jgi:hypothetical protein